MELNWNLYLEVASICILVFFFLKASIPRQQSFCLQEPPFYANES